MESVGLLPVEKFLLSYAHQRYQSIGFPTPQEVVVFDRFFSGAGSWTYLRHGEDIDVIDGLLMLAQVEFGEPSQLLLAELHFEDRRCKCLELIASGDSWDGLATGPFTLHPD